MSHQLIMSVAAKIPSRLLMVEVAIRKIKITLQGVNPEGINCIRRLNGNIRV